MKQHPTDGTPIPDEQPVNNDSNGITKAPKDTDSFPKDKEVHPAPKPADEPGLKGDAPKEKDIKPEPKSKAPNKK